MRQVSDVVFLIPGFLGFERFDAFAYFAGRLSAGLRAALQQRWGRTVPVDAVPMPPTSSLAERQRALAITLTRRVEAFEKLYGGPISRIHLVGHSTGGVDAQLLTLARPLRHASWQALKVPGGDFTACQRRLRSVISIASPHHGTCLAVNDIALALSSTDLLSRARHSLAAADDVKRAAVALAKALPILARDIDARDLLWNVLRAETSLSFFRRLHERGLIEDLSPAAAKGRYAGQDEAPHPVLRRSFVTVAGATADLGRNAPAAALALKKRAEPRARRKAPDASLVQAEFSAPDALFLVLSEATAGREADCHEDPALEPARRAIFAALQDPARRIAQRAEIVPSTIDGASNDGIVNTIRQLIDPHDPHELAAVVVADHFDVVGYYDNSLWTVDPDTGRSRIVHERAGLLHSGSEFRDDQLFALLHRIVNAMAPAF